MTPTLKDRIEKSKGLQYPDEEILKQIQTARPDLGEKITKAQSLGYEPARIVSLLSTMIDKGPPATHSTVPTRQQPGAVEKFRRTLYSSLSPLPEPGSGESLDDRITGLLHGIASIPSQVGSSLSRLGSAMTSFDVPGMAWHGAGAVPVVGPMAQQASEEMTSGAPAEGLAHATALLGPAMLGGMSRMQGGPASPPAGPVSINPAAKFAIRRVPGGKIATDILDWYNATRPEGGPGVGPALLSDSEELLKNKQLHPEWYEPRKAPDWTTHPAPTQTPIPPVEPIHGWPASLRFPGPVERPTAPPPRAPGWLSLSPTGSTPPIPPVEPIRGNLPSGRVPGRMPESYPPLPDPAPWDKVSLVRPPEGMPAQSVGTGTPAPRAPSIPPVASAAAPATSPVQGGTPGPIQPIQPVQSRPIGASEIPANAPTFKHTAEHTDLMRQIHVVGRDLNLAHKDISAAAKAVFGVDSTAKLTYQQLQKLNEFVLANKRLPTKKESGRLK